jgi:hypothetical protein
MPDSWHLGFLPNRLLSGVALCLSILLIGCTRARVAGPPPPHVPGPPPLYVRGPVNDLAAVRPRTMYGSLGPCLEKAPTDSRSTVP